MNGIQRVAVIIAVTGLITAAVLPGRKTADVITASGKVLTGWTKTAQGR